MAWGILDRFMRPKWLLDRILLVAEYVAETDGKALPTLLIATLRDHFGAERVCIHFADPTIIPTETHSALVGECPTERGSTIEDATQPAAEILFWQQALNTRKVVVASTLPAAVQDGIQPLLQRAGVNDAIAIPLIYRGSVYAVVSLFFARTVPSKLATAENVMRSIRLLGNLLYGVLIHEHQARSLDQSEGIAFSLAQASAARDGYGHGHVARGVALAGALGEAAGLNQIERQAVRKAALFRDIGKLHVPDYILQKPGPLNGSERALVREHPVAGESIMLEAAGSGDCAGDEVLALAAGAVRSHHERLDGSGYPAGLSGANVPPLACIIAIVDVFCSLTADRPYRAALPVARASQVLQELAGPALDADFVSLFLAQSIRAADSSDAIRRDEAVAATGAIV